MLGNYLLISAICLFQVPAIFGLHILTDMHFTPSFYRSIKAGTRLCCRSSIYLVHTKHRAVQVREQQVLCYYLPQSRFEMIVEL
jgi:hypothetical protein